MNLYEIAIESIKRSYQTKTFVDSFWSNSIPIAEGNLLITQENLLTKKAQDQSSSTPPASGNTGANTNKPDMEQAAVSGEGKKQESIHDITPLLGSALGLYVGGRTFAGEEGKFDIFGGTLGAVAGYLLGEKIRRIMLMREEENKAKEMQAEGVKPPDASRSMLDWLGSTLPKGNTASFFTGALSGLTIALLSMLLFRRAPARPGLLRTTSATGAGVQQVMFSQTPNLHSLQASIV